MTDFFSRAVRHVLRREPDDDDDREEPRQERGPRPKISVAPIKWLGVSVPFWNDGPAESAAELEARRRDAARHPKRGKAARLQQS
jgi:hypothetical protein